MKIVTDSSVMFSMEEGARRGMAVLPLVVTIDGQSWLEYEDVSAEEFLAKVRAGALPQSASPPPALTLKAYDTDEEVIHLAMADGLSGAYEVACGLVKQARRPDRVHVVNTRTLCVPHRVLACTAVRLAEQGTDARAILETLHAQITTAHSYLIPEDFDYLRRGGRLTPLAATFAHLVKAFPVMKQTDDGTRLEKMKVARSFAKAVNAIADGKKAAVNIDKYLGGSGELNMGEWLEIPVIPDMEVTEPHMRFPVRTLPVDERIDNFKEVACGFHKLDAIGEAFRCLHCDRR